MARGDGKDKANGKEFESELGKACISFPGKVHGNILFTHNSNSISPLCDRVILYKNRFLLLEAKECRSEQFDFKRIEKNERLLLSQVARAGGYSIILIKDVPEGRAFAIDWEDQRELEDGMGYLPPWELPAGKRNPRGSASISLKDGFRPPTLIEVRKLARKDFRGGDLGSVWDLWSTFCEMGIFEA